MFARQRGAIGMAIKSLADAETSGDSTALVRPQLLDLYCSTGQPDEALDLISGSIGDPNLGTEPGTATFPPGAGLLPHGQLPVNGVTLGRAVDPSAPDGPQHAGPGRGQEPHQRSGRGRQQHTSSRSPATSSQQASWNRSRRLRARGGPAQEAAKHFTNGLTIEPDLPTRPIAAYYLEKLGKPVPPKRTVAGAAATLGGTAKLEPDGAAPGQASDSHHTGGVAGPACPGRGQGKSDHAR